MRIRPPTPSPTVPDTNLPAGTPAGDFPRILHLGSGKSFHEDWLNLDVDPHWNPDILADLNQPFPGADPQFVTERFGPITLAPGTFDAVVACDLLEHVRELTTCMKSCLDLLKDGGVFHVQVPYDLSYGAWQDPTHLRAFNERSWLYYTDWCWYLGWEDRHFRLVKLEFNKSELGRQLTARGTAEDEILRTPRAIDAMAVQLVAQPTGPAIREQCRLHRSRDKR